MLIFLLYCIAKITTPYDRQVDDEEQLRYISEYQKIPPVEKR